MGFIILLFYFILFFFGGGVLNFESKLYSQKSHHTHKRKRIEIQYHSLIQWGHFGFDREKKNPSH